MSILFRSGPLRPDGDDKEALQRFYLRGMCGVLAVTLHRRLGYPIVGLFTPVWDTIPIHVGVRTPDGFGDARGLASSESAFVAGYDAPEYRIAPLSAEYVVRRFRREQEHYLACEGHLVTLGLVA